MTFVNPSDSPDFDASVGVGGQVIVNISQGLNPSTGYDSGFTYVGNAPAMFVQMSAGSNQLTFFQITWYTAPASQIVARTTYVFNQSPNSPVADLVLNKAPYVILSAFNLGVGVTGLDLFASSASANNGSLSCLVSRTLVSVANQVVAAGGQFIQNMISNVPGAAVWWVNSSVVGSVFFTLEQANISGGWTQFAQLDFNGTNSFSQFQQVSMDNSNFRLRVNNFTAGNVTVQSSLITLR